MMSAPSALRRPSESASGRSTLSIFTPSQPFGPSVDRLPICTGILSILPSGCAGWTGAGLAGSTVLGGVIQLWTGGLGHPHGRHADDIDARVADPRACGATIARTAPMRGTIQPRAATACCNLHGRLPGGFLASFNASRHAPHGLPVGGSRSLWPLASGPGAPSEILAGLPGPGPAGHGGPLARPMGRGPLRSASPLGAGRDCGAGAGRPRPLRAGVSGRADRHRVLRTSALGHCGPVYLPLRARVRVRAEAAARSRRAATSRRPIAAATSHTADRTERAAAVSAASVAATGNADATRAQLLLLARLRPHDACGHGSPSRRPVASTRTATTVVLSCPATAFLATAAIRPSAIWAGVDSRKL